MKVKFYLLLVTFSVLVLPRPGFSAGDGEGNAILEGDDVETTLDVLSTRTFYKTVANDGDEKVSDDVASTPKSVDDKSSHNLLTKKSKEKVVPLEQTGEGDDDHVGVVKKADPSVPTVGSDVDPVTGVVLTETGMSTSHKATKDANIFEAPTPTGEVFSTTRRRKKPQSPKKPKDDTGDKEAKGPSDSSLNNNTAVATNHSEEANVTSEAHEDTKTISASAKPVSESTTKKSAKAETDEESTPTQAAETTVVAVETPTPTPSTPEETVPPKTTKPTTPPAPHAVKTTIATGDDIKPGINAPDKSEENDDIVPPAEKPPHSPLKTKPPFRDDSGETKIDDDEDDRPGSKKGSDTGASENSNSDTPFKPLSIDDEDTGNTRFFVFLVIAVAVVLLIYMAYINRAKIMAIIVEGWSSRGARASRGSSSSGRNGYQYQPLATRPASNSQDPARRALNADDEEDDDETHIVMSAPLGAGSGGSSGRRSPATQDSVIVVDKKTLQAVKNYVY